MAQAEQGNSGTIAHLVDALKDGDDRAAALWASRLRCTCGHWLDEHTTWDGIDGTRYAICGIETMAGPCPCGQFILAEDG